MRLPANQTVHRCPAPHCLSEAMHSHPDQPMVQLSALLCLVPLALEDASLQASRCRRAASAAPALLQRCCCCCCGGGCFYCDMLVGLGRSPSCILPAQARALGILHLPATPHPAWAAPQVLVARHCLPAGVAAVEQHPGEPEVVSKALILLGVLGQASGCAPACWVCWVWWGRQAPGRRPQP